MSDYQELLKKIEMNKHDVVMRVRAIVKDPIDAINRKDAATDLYLQEQGSENATIQRLAEDIMMVFASKWRNVNDSETDQLKQMRATIKKVTTEIIPQAKRIVAFYDDCYQKSYYFSDNNAGYNAKKKFIRSVTLADEVYADLMTLESPLESGSEKQKIYQSFNLLIALQEVLDDIEADINYQHEYEVSGIEVIGDRKVFVDRVLLNLKENIVNHAFSTKSFLNKHIWEKKVMVKISQDKAFCVISISNNGEKFEGSLNNIFEYGYCYGEKKHNGIGMHSAREHMRAMGGDLEFKTASADDYSVCHIIKIPK
jgi:thymidylate synthase